MKIDRLSRKLHDTGTITGELRLAGSIGGGCINDCYRARAGGTTYFLKTNDADAYPGMFEKEAAGLRLLKGSDTLRIPEVIAVETTGGTSWLMLEYIAAGRRAPEYWEVCGTGLAALHRITAGTYGLDHDNYIGSLPQRNDQRKDWPGFFLEMRLVPQLETGRRNGWAGTSQFRQAENVARRIESDFPAEPASLLHGDLWSGNLMTGPEGEPVLVDPAVYYGNREIELAFTTLFGGFSGAFYEAYEAAWPTGPGFRERAAIYNLYPLMVHANLFGGHYVQQVLGTLCRF